MKVVHLLNSVHASGAETCLEAIGPLAIRAGISSTIIAMGSDSNYSGELRNAGYSVQEVNTCGVVKLSLRLYRELRKESPTVVHNHVERLYPVIMFVAWLSAPRARRIRTVHNVFTPSGSFTRLLRVFKCRVGDLFCDTVIACSDDVAQNEVAFGRTCRIVENWVRPDMFAPVPVLQRGALLILGNCNQAKNHSFVLDVLNSLAVVPDVFHVGDERNAPAAELKCFKELDGMEWLTRLGPAPSRSVMSKCSVLLVPSFSEGMSVAMLESLVSGLRVICSDGPGLRWAQNLPGITCLPLNNAAWREVLSEPDALLSQTDSSRRDHEKRFSALRGAADLLGIYFR